MGKRNCIYVGVIAFALVVFPGMGRLNATNDRFGSRRKKVKNLKDQITQTTRRTRGNYKTGRIVPGPTGPPTARARGSDQRTVNNSRREAPRLANHIAPPEPSFYRVGPEHVRLRTTICCPPRVGIHTKRKQGPGSWVHGRLARSALYARKTSRFHTKRRRRPYEIKAGKWCRKRNMFELSALVCCFKATQNTRRWA